MRKQKTELNRTLAEIKDLAAEDKETLLFSLRKLIPEKPIKTGVDKYEMYIINTYSCNTCGYPVGDEIMIFKYCPNCGKRIKALDKNDI